MSRNSAIRSLIALGVMIAISCSCLTPLNSIFPAATQEASATITASQGGQLTLPDKTVLKIPAGGLKTDTQVSIRKTTGNTVPTVQEEMATAGGAYEINLGTSSLVKPATLEIPFDPNILPNGSQPGQVFLSYYDEGAKKWVYAGGKVDTNRNVVVLEITHASWWMPATWNWAAWIAVLDKVLKGNIAEMVEAVKLLTDDCLQIGQYVQVDSSQARNLVQGCVEQDDSKQPILRVINPKSFFYEIKPISGGNGYPSPALLSPGEDVKFQASTSNPSPLIVEADMTQKSGWYLVIDMVITMLPGANEFGIQGSKVACITERLSDVSYFVSAAESLAVSHDGAAAAASISDFLKNGDAVQRFITAADDCNFGPAPTWSVEGLKQIGGAVSTILSSTDYIANYFAGNSGAQVSFSWTKPASGITNNANDLIGVWEGDLEYQTDSGDKGIAPVVIEFSFECKGEGSPCLINRDSSNPSNNWLLPFLSQNGPEFCFGNTDVMARYCFTQQADGTLWANGGNGFVVNTGFLHRKTNSDPSTTPLPADWWPDSLIGIWEGNVTNNTNFQGQSQIYLTLEIRRTTNGQMIVIQDMFPDIEQGEYTNSQTTDGDFYYCFNDYQVFAGDRMLTGVRCFKPINDNQLRYFGGDMDISQSGTLTRVK